MGKRSAKNGPGALMVALFAAVTTTAAYAAGEPTDRNASTWQSDPVVTQLETYTSRKDWQGAAAYMKTAVERNPNSADYNNLYAYVMRKGPNPDMDLVLKHYNEALRIDPKHRAGSLYDLIAPPPESPGSAARRAPAEKWNTARIRISNGLLTHFLNGEKTAECRIDGAEWKAMIAGSKFKDMAGFGMEKKGHIALQDHGDEVAFRNIRVRRLDGN